MRAAILKVTNPLLEEANAAVDDMQRLYDEAVKFEQDSPTDKDGAYRKWVGSGKLAKQIVRGLNQKVKDTSGESRKVMEDALRKCAAIHERIVEECIGTDMPGEEDKDAA